MAEGSLRAADRGAIRRQQCELCTEGGEALALVGDGVRQSVSGGHLSVRGHAGGGVGATWAPVHSWSYYSSKGKQGCRGAPSGTDTVPLVTRCSPGMIDTRGAPGWLAFVGGESIGPSELHCLDRRAQRLIYITHRRMGPPHGGGGPVGT